VSELQKSLDSRNREFDKQTNFLDRLQKLVANQKSEIDRLRAKEDVHRGLACKTESLETHLKVRNCRQVTAVLVR